MDTTKQLDEIERAALSLSIKAHEITTLREGLGVIEAREVLTIQTLKDDQGKAIYANEAARGAALTLKLREHAEHKQLSARLRECEYERARLTATHERQRQEWKLYLIDRQAEIARASEYPADFPHK